MKNQLIFWLFTSKEYNQVEKILIKNIMEMNQTCKYKNEKVISLMTEQTCNK